MTKQERLHWFYTVLLIIAIGTIHVIVGVNIAYKWSRGYTDQKIEQYDSTVTKRNQAQYDSIKLGINDIKQLMNDSHNE